MILIAKIGIGIYWSATLAYMIFPLPLPEFLPRWIVPALAGFILFLHVLEFLWFRSKHPGAARPADFWLTMVFGFAHLFPRHEAMTKQGVWERVK